MADPNPSVRVPKRRRITKKSNPMIEDDDAALDTAIYRQVAVPNTSGGSRKVPIPIRLDEPVLTAAAPNIHKGAESDGYADMLEPDMQEPDMPEEQYQSKQQWTYLQEFVSRIDTILPALLDREAIKDGQCGQCSVAVGLWRCQDCSGDRLLCRCCMRHSHMHNPYHRIEHWTGTYFRDAALWEVGVFIALNHRDSPILCSNLLWQHRTLESFQCQKDQLEVDPANQCPPAFGSAPAPAPTATSDPFDPSETNEEYHPDDVLEEDDEIRHGDAEADLEDIEAGAAGFVHYIGNSCLSSDDPLPPAQDALNNQYVRVVHTNGIHHIALVSCNCRGQESAIQDLIYARLIPTSFKRIRTLFTTAVLDQFRYSNLEMMSSAYQFFQMLRRVTMPMAPTKVVNLYHELRRLSRLWRWMKKLKWNGYGQDAGQPIVVGPGAGELGIFCPACPQAGINIPLDWKDDSNKWVYRRFFVADGNFKADHVRQKHKDNDIWLSDGTGMTTRRAEYQSFLETAQERNTVCNRDIFGPLAEYSFPNRKHLVKILSERLNRPCNPPKRAT